MAPKGPGSTVSTSGRSPDQHALGQNSDQPGEAVKLVLSKPETERSAPSPDRPWVALIIDDFGPSLDRKLIQGFLELRGDLTISIIPGNDRTVRTAKTAVSFGKEVFIHMPMEPLDSVAMDEPVMVYADADCKAIANTMQLVLKELPMAVGLNNHMGSKTTRSTEVMKNLGAELLHRQLVFVDSRTVPDSQGLKVMKEVGVQALGRDVFIDFYHEPLKIDQQLEKLKNIARHRGWALGIGHVKWETLTILQQELPRWPEEGITLVFASKLVQAVATAEQACSAPR